MAHFICGVDVGSHSIKVAVVETRFRHHRLAQIFQVPVAPGPTPLVERQGEAVRAAVAQLPAETTVYAALPGELLSIRMLDLPFSDARKIEQVVGYELEGQIVHALEDVVFDHMVVRTPAEGSTVMAAAVKKDDVAAHLGAMQAAGLDPRGLFAASLVYRALDTGAALDEAAGPDAPAQPCRALVDIGAMRTNVCVLQGGEAVYGRTLTRGGEHLTLAVAEAFRCSRDQAEGGKVQEGMLAAGGLRPDTPVKARLAQTLREAMDPLLRDLRQTLSSFRAATKLPVEGILLTGGSSRLPGLAALLSQELDLPAEPLSLVLAPDDAADPAEASSLFALAIACARAGARGKKEIDFRRGPFVYRATISLLRGKGLHVAALVTALVVAASVDAVASLSQLGKERAVLDDELKIATSELFGEARSDARAVSILLKKGFREEIVPLPKATAYDLLGEISRRMPSDEKVKLDVTELDIRAKKTFIKGTVDSAAAVDEIATKLKEIECFEDVTKGAITEVAGGAKQFTLTIASKCP